MNSVDAILADPSVTHIRDLIRLMVDHLYEVHNLQAQGILSRDVVSTALDREKLGSTGVGNGVALPHARLPGLDRIYTAFARLSDPIDFDAIDGRPVDLVCLILAPLDDGGAYLRNLAQVSRLLRRADLRQRLRSAPDAEALSMILISGPDTAAA